jgi:hypothetical protein
MMNAGQHVEQRPRRRRGKAHTVGCQRRHAERAGQCDQRRVVLLFVAAEMPLQFDIDVAAAEDADDPIEQAADAVAAAVERGTADHRHQSIDAAIEFVERQRALAFGRAHFHAGDQLAEVAVAGLRFAEDLAGQTAKSEVRSLKSASFHQPNGYEQSRCATPADF